MSRPVTRRSAGSWEFATWDDERGVPHIQADSLAAGLAGLGYLHARDRRTQLTFARTVAEGRAAELIAGRDDLLATDRLMRQAGLTDGLDDEVQNLTDEHRELLDAYCAGVNEGLTRLGRSIVMRLTGYSFEPWSSVGVLAVGQLLAYGALAIDQQESERLVIDLIRAIEDDRQIEALFPGRLAGVPFDLVRKLLLRDHLSERVQAVLQQIPQWTASNAFAVHRSRSATGGAILAGDPHLEIDRLPSIWYECVLELPTGFVMGATLPGCPLFAVARTPRLAWSVTYMKGDTIDHAIEEVRPAEGEGWLIRRDRPMPSDAGPTSPQSVSETMTPAERNVETVWEPLAFREILYRRRGAEPLTERQYFTDAGTFLTDPDTDGPGLHLAMDWTGRRPGASRAITVWLDLLAAKSVDQARAVVRHCPQPSLVFVLADGDGAIGWQGCGRFPLRPTGVSGLGPRPAWVTAGQPGALRDVETLPGETNPPEGFVATANNELPDPWGRVRGQPVQSRLLPSYRVRRLGEILAEPGPIDRDRLERAQYDLVSLQARDLLTVFLPDLTDTWVREALAAWDTQLTVESREATLFAALRREVIAGLLSLRSGLTEDWIRHLVSRAGWSELFNEAADRLLLASAGIASFERTSFDRSSADAARTSEAGSSPSPWETVTTSPPGTPPPGPEVWFTAEERRSVIAATGVTLASMASSLADVPPWGDVNAFVFSDRFLAGVWPLAWLGWTERRHRMPGSTATPLQGHVTVVRGRVSAFAPSYRMVTDLSEPIAWTNAPGGRNESPLARSYQLGLADWMAGLYKPLRASRSDEPNAG